ncbi:hypothetical protein HDV00_009129 [Rhizophlyctis rosea]|nr:hypothetical protein HDV00_009129 [Rhizophlyctis rosea]
MLHRAEPANLPHSARGTPEDCPISLTVTFPDGPRFYINEDFDFSFRITPSTRLPTPPSLKIKSITIQIIQVSMLKAGTPPFFSGATDEIFTWSRHPRTPDEFARDQRVTACLNQNERVAGKIIVPTRKRTEENLFIVDHAIRIRVALSGVPDVMVSSPATVYKWKKGDMRGFVEEQGEVVREAVYGLAPEYDAPEYVPADSEVPTYDEAQAVAA